MIGDRVIFHRRTHYDTAVNVERRWHIRGCTTPQQRMMGNVVKAGVALIFGDVARWLSGCGAYVADARFVIAVLSSVARLHELT